MPKPLPIFTNSSLSTFRSCRYRYYLRYVLGLRKTYENDALRIGGAFGKGLELIGLGVNLETAIGAAVAPYAQPGPWVEDLHAWEVEAVTVETMLRGWAWRWSTAPARYVATEKTVHATLTKPATRRKVMVAGKIDALTNESTEGMPERPAGIETMREYKTAGEDIGPDSDYWPRLKADSQISLYLLLLQANGMEGTRIMYDVTRKPSLRPSQTPVLDDQGLKIVEDAEGNRVMLANGKPRQAGDIAKGWTLKTTRETPQQYGARVLEDMFDRPEEYFQRREITRTQEELDRTRAEVIQTVGDILTVQGNGRWYRNPGRMTCDRCSYKGICLGSPAMTVDSPLPSGYIKTEDLHPELKETE
jgi:hypothetical protein